MCGGEHAERTVLRCRIIEVDSQSHNLGESICWSVCVDDAIFYRPRSPALRFLAQTASGSRGCKVPRRSARSFVRAKTTGTRIRTWIVDVNLHHFDVLRLSPLVDLTTISSPVPA